MKVFLLRIFKVFFLDELIFRVWRVLGSVNSSIFSPFDHCQVFDQFLLHYVIIGCIVFSFYTSNSSLSLSLSSLNHIRYSPTLLYFSFLIAPRLVGSRLFSSFLCTNLNSTALSRGFFCSLSWIQWLYSSSFFTPSPYLSFILLFNLHAILTLIHIMPYHTSYPWLSSLCYISM